MFYNIEETKAKLNDSNYLSNLILIHDDLSFNYPNEWSKFMISISQNISESINKNGSMPFVKSDFKFFIDGTVSKLFKNSLSTYNNKEKIEEVKTKLAHLVYLPESISLILFSQDDMIDIISSLDNHGIIRVCSNLPTNVLTIIGGKLLKKYQNILNSEEYRIEKYKLIQIQDELTRLEKESPLGGNFSKIEDDISKQDEKVKTYDKEMENYKNKGIEIIDFATEKILSKNSTLLQEETQSLNM